MREFIVEADGGSRGNPGPAGYGSVVIEAASGETLAEAAEYIGIATNNVAEYRGLIAGLRAAHALDPSAAVHVRMDSKLAVEQMSSRWKIKHPDLKPLAAEANRVFPPERVTYEWIPRERNKHADRLANEAMDAGGRGEQWSPSTSTAELDASAAERARAAAPEPSGPPGDATAGAARARAALADVRAARTVAADGPKSAAAQPTKSAPSAEAPKETSKAAPKETSKAVPKEAPAPGWSAPDLGAPATFVLLRHGETPLTPQKRFSGSGGTDPSLSDVGREQAERVAAALARRGTIQAVVASPLTRTRETAGIVAARLGLDVTVDEGLRETDFGAWEGLTFGEVRERHPDDLNAWLADPEARPTGDGESFAATATRIAATRDKLIAAYQGRTVLLVTHVTPIKTLVRLALGAPPESLFRMELSAASLSAVAYYADGNASVRLLNDTSHLR
ncbi:bifunctional RNase H/acid phosphatase [Streptomyces olivochromogenes]|uniref:bifunctional RNase H/acid phosphatase n=1 Tax=Streptomyces olivochromogenes TaxID=1963 RepID=UPI001F2158A9|nr:bifunctional RNase H/acid phosphatase [Streptomyces olivochromogenes]MCF3134194.1 bifunctional RNase H/acid phosphatase [Streptomyces olivochromogenes]